MSYIVKFGPQGKMSPWKNSDRQIQKFKTKAAAQKLINTERRGLFGPLIKGWKWKIIAIK